MRRQATMMPHDCVQWAARDIVIDTRVAPDRKTGRDVMQFRIVNVEGASSLPADATCVLDAWRGKENVQQRVEVGAAHTLSKPTKWFELPRLPADAKFRETKFRLKAVSPSSRIIAICERLSSSSSEQSGTAGLFAIEVCSASTMRGAIYDISPDWNGGLPMSVRVSDALPKAEQRLTEDDPELSLAILSMLVPHALLHMFPRAQEDGDDEFYTAWTGFMLLHGVDEELIAAMASPETDPAERGRLSREAAARLVEAFAARLGGGEGS